MQHLEDLTWNQLVEELRALADHEPSADGPKDDPRVVLHNLFVHQVELEMQNRELRDSQQRLEASRARYADLYDFAPVGCLTVGTDERIQEINLTGAALLGRDRAEIIGKPFLVVVTVRDGAMAVHEHFRTCLEGRCRVDAEIEFVPKGRGAMLLHLTTVPLFDPDGEAFACRVALTDVTDRRRADLAEADARMKDEFLATVSHELRTPLAAIAGWSQIVLDRDRSDVELDRGMVRRGLEVIARNAATQSLLIEDILDASSILAGKLRVERKPMDLEPLVRAAVENLRPATLAKRVELSVDVAPDALVSGDGVRVTQVLSNLLNNSLKFTPSGGSIVVRVTTEPDFVLVVVRDTGCGIAEQDLPHVFERFRQVDTSMARTAGGLGLGLAIVDHIVRAHGGSASASSPGLGLGTTFSVRLRRAPRPPVEERAAPPSSEEDSLEGRKVLCVDDDADLLEVMSLILGERGAVVSTARSAADALAFLSTLTADAVVSDIGLPGMDGFALVRQIRALPGDAARIPAIALTAYASATTEERAREAGFQRVLGKPFALEQLVHSIACVIRR
jgi:PAS domain S-box-containing protein